MPSPVFKAKAYTTVTRLQHLLQLKIITQFIAMLHCYLNNMHIGHDIYSIWILIVLDKNYNRLVLYYSVTENSQQHTSAFESVQSNHLTDEPVTRIR